MRTCMRFTLFGKTTGGKRNNVCTLGNITVVPKIYNEETLCFNHGSTTWLLHVMMYRNVISIKFNEALLF